MGRIRLVADQDVVLERKGKFSIHEVFAWHGGMIEPLEEVAEGKQTLVEGTHDVWIREG